MKRIHILIAAALMPLGLFAQNLNPEVQVTNEYQTRLNDVSKQGPSMSVPDSLLRFDYHFDYSVFDSPYKGAYEFSPYAVDLAPSASPYDGRKFYLRGGAGYVFRPELETVWSVLDRKKAAVNVFASGRGFYGDYKQGPLLIPVAGEIDEAVFYKGYDFSAKAGVDSRFNIGPVLLRAEIGCEGLFNDHQLYKAGIGYAPYASVRAAYQKPGAYSYGVGVRYRYVDDRHDGLMPVNDHDVRIDGNIAPHLSGNYRVEADVQVAVNTFYTAADVHPHAAFSMGIFDVDAGFRLGWFVDKVSISPAVNLNMRLFKDYVNLYLFADGRNHMPSYWDYKSYSHRYHTSYTTPLPVHEIADLGGGFRGYAPFGLQYDIKAGYKFVENSPFWAVSASNAEAILYQDCNLFHADLALAWVSERVNFDGSLHYQYLPDGVGDRIFSPAELYGEIRGGYNWMKRIYAGLSVSGCTQRQATVGTRSAIMPGYVNLGVWGEYKFNDRFSAWLEGRNLLNQDVRFSPIYCEFGPSVTAGITISL